MIKSSFSNSLLPSLLLSLVAFAPTFAPTFAPIATAETIYSAPLGSVTATVNAQADLRLGVPLMPSPSCSGTVSSVIAGTVTTASTVPDVTTNAHFIWITSGTLLGKWYEVTGSSVNSVTVAENLQSEGLLATDSFKVVPFWTFNTLFPDGGSIPASADPYAPDAYVLLNDVTVVGIDLVPSFAYFYYDGSIGGSAGWYESGNLGAGLRDNVIISPESYISIRNTTSNAISVQIGGTVPASPVSNKILQHTTGKQDNQISNPFPVGITLASSNLFIDGVVIPSPDPYAPTELLYVFDTTPTGYDPVADRAFFYYDGSIGGTAGWYESGNLGAGLQDTYMIPSGAALMIRKQGGSDAVISWTPPTPYSL